jgi:hypothetical protein
VYRVDGLASGSRSAASVVRQTRGPSAAASRAEAALVALSPERVVWWRGWSSGTVMAA